MAATLTQAGKTRGAYKQGSKADVIKEIELGVPRSKAPGCCNVSRQTFYDWLEQDSTFAQGVEFAEARLTKRRLEHVEGAALIPYSDRPDTKTLYRLLESTAPEFRTTPETLINIGHLGNNLIVSEEKVDKLRKLRDEASKRTTEQLANAREVKGNETLASSQAEQSASAYLLAKALANPQAASLKKLPE